MKSKSLPLTKRFVINHSRISGIGRMTRWPSRSGRPWIALGLLLAAVLFNPMSARAGTCGLQMLMEYNVGEAARMKVGVAGFQPFGTNAGFVSGLHGASGETDIYRKSVQEDFEWRIISSDTGLNPTNNCKFTNSITRTINWPTDYSPTNTCGTMVAPTNDVSNGYEFLHQTGVTPDCVRTLTANVWDITNACVACGSDFEYRSITNSTYWQKNISRELTNSANWNAANAGGVLSKTTLYNFYPTSELINRLLTDATNAATWTCAGSSYFNLSADRVCSSARIMKFRYKYVGMEGVEGDFVFRINYFKTNQANVATNWSVMITNHVVCDGTVHTSAEVDCSAPSGADVRGSSVTVDVVEGGGSGSCTKSTGFGQVSLRFGNDINCNFGLGSCSGTASPGFLFFAGTNNPSLANVSSLQEFVNLCAVDIRKSTNISQYKILSDGTLVVVTNDASGVYGISYYSAAGMLNATTGLYEPAGGANLVKTFPVRLISTTPVFEIDVQETGSVTRKFIQTNGWWFIDQGDGLWGQGMLALWNEEGWVEERTLASFDASGGTITSETTTYATIAGRPGTVPVIRTVGLGAERLTNTWAYNINVDTNQSDYGKLLQSVDGHGGWNRYSYNTNSGLMVKTIATVGNLGTNAAEADSRVTTYSYTPVDGRDDGTLEPSSPRETIETLQGTTISKQRLALWPSNRLDIKFYTLFMIGSDGVMDNLVTGLSSETLTTELNVANGSGQRIMQLYNPGAIGNGLVQFIYTMTNAAGTYVTNIVMDGAINSGAEVTNVIDGTKTVTVTGNADRKTYSSTTYDILSGKITSQRTYSYFGTDNRSYTITSLDGTTETSNYSDCCGQISSVVGRDGVTTQYTYDVLKRQVTTSRSGIVSSNVFDGAGNTLETWRFPTSGSPVRTAAFTYDTLGRVKTSKDALNRTTTNTYDFASDGRFIEGTLNPDGSTSYVYKNKDGTTERLIGTAVQANRYEYQAQSTYARTTKVIALDTSTNANGSDTLEYTITCSDSLGRQVGSARSGGAFEMIYYDTAGRVIGRDDPDSVRTVFAYNARGEQSAMGVDMVVSDPTPTELYSLDSSVDRRTRTETEVVSKDGTWDVRRTRTYVWKDDGSEICISTNEAAVDGLRSWQTGPGGVSQSVTSISGTNRTVTSTAPDGSYTVAAYGAGRLLSMTSYASGGASIGSMTYGYDPHGRQNTTTDARTGTTTYTFDDADQTLTVTTPSPAQVTTQYYDAGGRVWRTALPDGTSVTNEFYASGALKKTYGSRTYPVEYTYDYAGRMKTMKTWQTYSGGAGTPATTTWKYDGYRGFLTNKVYADGTGPSYTYTAAGRPATISLARSATRTMTYNNAGELATLTYSDGSIPALTYSYNRQGQLLSVSQSGANTLTRQYSDVGILLSETDANNVTVSNRFDNFLRRTNVTILTGTASIGFGYSFDAAGRLSTASQPALFGNQTISATYSYLTNSPLVSQIELKENGATRLTTTKGYDNLNRLTEIKSAAGAASLFKFNYVYNSANQRVAVTNTDSSTWAWQYDYLGQVKSAKKSWSDNAPVAGQQLEYVFDDIGNRTSTKVGGDTAGANQRSASYSPNNLNQYTSRTVPPFVEVQGAATNSATLTVNGQSPSRHGEYFRAELAVDNAAAPVWLSVTNLGLLLQGTNVLAAATTGHLLVPPATQTFTHDLDGNQTSDGVWTNTWNAENRMMTTETLSTVPVPVRRREVWSYLPDGRWSQRIVSTNNGTSYFPSFTNRYVWDCTVLLAVLDHTNGVVMTFLRGLDLSGSMQGAGGVGGVLAVSFATNGTHFDAYDGNGNVAGLVAASNATVTATYEYAAFGEMLRATGPAAGLNPIQFSTQYADEVSGDLKFLFRVYSVSNGKWKNTDPMEENGGVNVYAFIDNNPLSEYDVLGLVGGGRGTSPLQKLSATLKLVNAEIADWKRNGHGFAVNLANHFLANSGKPYIASDAEIDLIKSSSNYRNEANRHFQSLAYRLCGEGRDGTVTISSGFSGGPWAFETSYWTGDLFYALGGAHFYYEGEICLNCKKGTWVADVLMSQSDNYTYIPQGWGGYRTKLSTSYTAFRDLETKYGYKSFVHTETWHDIFQRWYINFP